MKTIWKFPIEITDEQTVSAPCNWRPLSAQVQHGEACIWAMVDDQEPKVSQTVYVNGTGHPIKHNGTFLGTIQIAGGQLVFHVFVEPSKGDA